MEVRGTDIFKPCFNWSNHLQYNIQSLWPQFYDYQHRPYQTTLFDTFNECLPKDDWPIMPWV